MPAAFLLLLSNVPPKGGTIIQGKEKELLLHLSATQGGKERAHLKKGLPPLLLLLRHPPSVKPPPPPPSTEEGGDRETRKKRITFMQKERKEGLPLASCCLGRESPTEDEKCLASHGYLGFTKGHNSTVRVARSVFCRAAFD